MNSMELLYGAVCAALAAGKDILDVYLDPNSDFGIEKKADNSPLTIADKKAHERILSFLTQTPYPILSEEGKHMDYAVRKEWNTLWIVDPLDGTKEFIKKNGEFTVNIALVKGGVPVLGVIYVPVKEELYLAEEQLGAFKLQNIAPGSCPESMESLLHDACKLPMEQPEKKAFVIVRESGDTLQRKFHQNLSGCRRRSRCISTLCTDYGMGHGCRTCHCPCRWKTDMAHGFAVAVTIQQRGLAEPLVHCTVKNELSGLKINPQIQEMSFLNLGIFL